MRYNILNAKLPDRNNIKLEIYPVNLQICLHQSKLSKTDPLAPFSF